MGDAGYGIDPATLRLITAEIIEAQGLGVEIGVVIGGGNIFDAAPVFCIRCRKLSRFSGMVGSG